MVYNQWMNNRLNAKQVIMIFVIAFIAIYGLGVYIVQRQIASIPKKHSVSQEKSASSSIANYIAQ